MLQHIHIISTGTAATTVVCWENLVVSLPLGWHFHSPEPQDIARVVNAFTVIHETESALQRK
jgi:hypothetical protein